MGLKRWVFLGALAASLVVPQGAGAAQYSYGVVRGDTSGFLSVDPIGDLGTHPGVFVQHFQGSGGEILYAPQFAESLKFAYDGPEGTFVRLPNGYYLPANQSIVLPAGQLGQGTSKLDLLDEGFRPLKDGPSFGPLAADDPRNSPQGAQQYEAQQLQQNQQAAAASQAQEGALVQCDLCTIPELVDLAVNIFNWLIKIGGVAAVLAMVVAGIRIIVAVLEGASSQTITAAKQSLSYAVLGTIFLLTAYVIVNTVYHALTRGAGKPPGLL